MSNNAPKATLSELVMTAIFVNQRKNGVSIMEIANYIGEKLGCNPCKLRKPVEQILKLAKEHGIMSECKGKYRIECQYDEKIQLNELKPKNEECNEEQNENGEENECDKCTVMEEASKKCTEEGKENENNGADGNGNAADGEKPQCSIDRDVDESCCDDSDRYWLMEDGCDDEEYYASDYNKDEADENYDDYDCGDGDGDFCGPQPKKKRKSCKKIKRVQKCEYQGCGYVDSRHPK